MAWIDRSCAQVWLGFSRFPAWYVVMFMGTTAFLLTLLTFTAFLPAHDPTLQQLASQGRKLVPATRESLEEAGDWATQDKWRLAHFFVDHRPPKGDLDIRIDSSLIDDFPPGGVPSRRDLRHRRGLQSRYDQHPGIAEIVLPEHEVRLDLAPPKVAEQPKRLIYGRYIREPGVDPFPVRTASTYRSRDSRLLVQAEWAVGSDCESGPVSPPRRRLIPVPDPQWDELPPIPELTDNSHPDLSFQMVMLREFLPPMGQFPPRSRLISVSAQSEFPESLFVRHRSNPFSEDSTAWMKTSDVPLHRDRPLEPYIDRAIPASKSPAFDLVDLDLPPGSVSSFAEVALSLEISEPPSAISGQSGKSSLVLRNTGLGEIPLVEIREPLANLDTVIDANPPAAYNKSHSSLERKIERLEPGQQERLELTWRSDSEGMRTHRTIVTVHSVVAATTEIVRPIGEQPMPSVAPEPVPPRRNPEPEEEDFPIPVKRSDPVREIAPELPPGVSFEIRNKPKANVEDLVEFEIIVKNTGGVDLHNVRVSAHLPQQLKHPHGTEVEYVVGVLPINGSRQTILRAVAQEPGNAICKLDVAAEEPAEAKSEASVEVIAKPVRSESPKIAKPSAKPKPAPVPAPIARQPAPPRTQPANNCCCQSQAAGELPFDPWYLP